MNLVLEKVQPNSALGKTASVDLFDASGMLLLQKGQLITEGIKVRLKKREVYILHNQRNVSFSEAQKVKTFPKDVYIKLVGSLWSIYHDAKLVKPEQIQKTVILVETILEELQTQKFYLDFNVIRLDMEKFKQHDYSTFVHVVNVALLTALTGIWMGYKENSLKYLTLGALLHDLGKLQIPREILNKPGSLTDEEFKIIRKHTFLGEKMLKNSRLSSSVLAMVREHHERWNGKGYPLGLYGKSIHINAQIVAVADVYEALTADRPYRKGLPPYHALEMIISWSGIDFNPKVVQAFRESLILYPENAIVTLNTGEVGVVVAVPTQMPTRPLVRILFDSNGRFLNRETYVDLLQELTRFIGRIEFKEDG
ncbi:MAG: hypothetical protein APF81_06760 [Desulfosporosinus sp. BRH_c37]|nr:MAG: hypothetical protein APF81_06760 [Desulfosporosinus sp. BRH_c37]